MSEFRASTLVDLLNARARQDPDRELVRFDDGTRLRIGDVDDGSRTLAARLRVAPGTRVLTCVRPGRAAVELLFGLARQGAVEVPLALDVTLPAAQSIRRSTGAELLVAGTSALAANPGLLNLAERVVLIREDDPAPSGHPFLDELPTASRREHRPQPGDALVVLSTSGTTGRAKAAELPHFAAIRHARRVAATMGYGPGDVLLNVFPWNHVNVRHTALLPALLTGARLVAHRRFSASRFWEICRAEGVTAFNFMGAMLAILDRRGTDHDHAVRLAYGAPAPAELAARFLDRFGVKALEAYASTELGDVAANTPDDWRPGTAGRVVPEYEVAILDETGQPLPHGETGQIAVRAKLPDIRFRGYAGDPGATAAVLRDGWFRTGDRGRLDADGYLVFAGRRGDVVRRRGENIATWDVEQVLRALPGVVDAAAVGVESDLTEQELLVVLATDRALDGPAVRDWCRTRLPRHAQPRYVRIARELPRNGSGKVVKALLPSTVDESVWDARSAQ
ncbi:AMP-binding protein [Amycolatopsis sp. SID8362]|uniref:class I adenylate-forming enzyme family protein n=1 Tax=Amycolatopsis sp. SID8362 TaxID=2690346 RepID=UPI00136EA11B|nr:AMP-binding protein [Amycolatopsis sp. SID8362]NBH10958.1 AMP-binding protein [Amycolatopsis sp. SID8362]NED47649.1 AMP-binding protein [Amycolatopsis sp. SID8362]